MKRQTLVSCIASAIAIFACGGADLGSLGGSSDGGTSSSDTSSSSDGGNGRGGDGGSSGDAASGADGSSSGSDSGTTRDGGSGGDSGPSCGVVGKPCCSGSDACVSGARCDDVGCVACGAAGEECCGGGAISFSCSLGSACATLDGTESCYVASYSVPGGACNSGHACPSGTICAGGYCLDCGQFGQRCCTGDTCAVDSCQGDGLCH